MDPSFFISSAELILSQHGRQSLPWLVSTYEELPILPKQFQHWRQPSQTIVPAGRIRSFSVLRLALQILHGCVQLLQRIHPSSLKMTRDRRSGRVWHLLHKKHSL